MSAQIDQIFTAKAENIWQFLHAAGQGCYIPAYQRPYAWDSENVDRLFEDAVNGLNHLVDRPTAISFLGTIIAIHDTNLVTVKPVFQSEVAQRVMTLIDGQQRVSTSVMVNIALHHHISTQLRKIEKTEGEAFDWIREQGKTALADLWTTFALDQTVGTPEVNRYYPRVIRAFDDVWSKKGVQASYRSPIARLTWTYINYDFEKKTDAFNYKVVDETGVTDSKHEAIAAVFRYIKKEIAALTGKQSANYDFPDLQQVVRNDNFMKALWSFVPPDALVKFVTEQSDHKQFEPASSILRALMFHKYFNTRMALTVVTTRSEDDAFDMFEALNTTGEPLTAFETFKPKVIESEGLQNYQDSSSYKSITRVEEHLDTYKKADDRQRATSELLIPFALSETGDKLQKNLSDQRRYLRDYFEKLPNLEAKQSTVVSLANLSTLIRTGWIAEEATDIEAVGPLDQETGFCFQALRQLKHAVTLGALARFYESFRLSDEDERNQRRKEFTEAIKATAAFSMLWRGAHGGTENIDSIYRSVMREGSQGDSILPLAKRPKNDGSLGAVSLSGYKRMLWSRLSDKFPDREAWIKSAARLPIYSHSAVVAKFLLICASDDAALDPQNQGLIIRGTTGLAPLVRKDAWGADVHYSVEHIAPQAQKSSGWSESLYEDNQTVDRLGNLTLLPIAANSYIGKKPWAHKRLIYRYLSSETPNDAEQVYATFAAAGLTVGKSGSTVLGNAAYMPMCKALGTCKEEWTLDMVERRSSRLAELAYDRIVGWLKP